MSDKTHTQKEVDAAVAKAIKQVKAAASSFIKDAHAGVKADESLSKDHQKGFAAGVKAALAAIKAA